MTPHADLLVTGDNIAAILNKATGFLRLAAAAYSNHDGMTLVNELLMATEAQRKSETQPVEHPHV